MHTSYNCANTHSTPAQEPMSHISVQDMVLTAMLVPPDVTTALQKVNSTQMIKIQLLVLKH